MDTREQLCQEQFLPSVEELSLSKMLLRVARYECTAGTRHKFGFNNEPRLKKVARMRSKNLFTCTVFFDRQEIIQYKFNRFGSTVTQGYSKFIKS